MPRSEIFEVNGWVDEPYVNSLVSAPFLRHTKALWLGRIFKGKLSDCFQVCQCAGYPAHRDLERGCSFVLPL